MATTRTRLANVRVEAGRLFRVLTSGTLDISRVSDKDTCVDVVPAMPDQEFTVNHLTSTAGGILTGNTGPSMRVLIPCPVPSLDESSGNYVAHLVVPGMSSDAIYATKVAGETNPSEPIVGLGETIAELREIPGQLRKRGIDLYNSFNYRNRSKRKAAALLTGAAADLNLRYQFGIKPIVNDLVSLLNIRESLNFKIRDLIMSERKGGLIRKRDVFSGTVVQDWSAPKLLFSAWGTNSYIRARFKSTTTVTKWVVCRWVPDGTRKLPYHKDYAFHRAFRSKVFGLDIFNARNIWNTLPWSWLVDWSFNVGDYLSATNNTVGIVLKSVVVCTTTKTTQYIEFTTLPTGISCQPFSRTLTTKTRRNVTLNILPKLQLLTGRQVGILASIARSK